ncbi:DUF2080 family transposase-associated protein [Archaeoglobus sp. UBA230]
MKRLRLYSRREFTPFGNSAKVDVLKSYIG